MGLHPKNHQVEYYFPFFLFSLDAAAPQVACSYMELQKVHWKIHKSMAMYIWRNVLKRKNVDLIWNKKRIWEWRRITQIVFLIGLFKIFYCYIGKIERWIKPIFDIDIKIWNTVIIWPFQNSVNDKNILTENSEFLWKQISNEEEVQIT